MLSWRCLTFRAALPSSPAPQPLLSELRPAEVDGVAESAASLDASTQEFSRAAAGALSQPRTLLWLALWVGAAALLPRAVAMLAPESGQLLVNGIHALNLVLVVGLALSWLQAEKPV